MINLSWTKVSSFDIMERFFAHSCSNLTTLKLDNCSFLNQKLLRVITDSCLNLENLSLSSCQSIYGLDDKDSNPFESIHKLKYLENLNLYRTLVNQESIIKIIESCKNLKHINLGSCINISDFDTVLECISSNCNKIKSLDLWRAYSLTSKGIARLAESCFDLEELDLGWWFVLIS